MKMGTRGSWRLFSVVILSAFIGCTTTQSLNRNLERDPAAASGPTGTPSGTATSASPAHPSAAVPLRLTECPFNTYQGGGTKWKNELLIYHFFVGQGDSTFVRTPSGTTLLIDAGLQNQANARILPILKICGITSLDYAILTHPHTDHYGGFLDIMKAGTLPIKKAFYFSSLYDDKYPVDSTGHRVANAPESVWGTLKTLVKQKVPAWGGAVDASGSALLIPTTGDDEIIDEAGDVAFSLIAVNAQPYKQDKVASAFRDVDQTLPKDTNSISLALIISYGNFVYWTGGDMTGGGIGRKGGKPDVESAVAKIPNLPLVDVYHVHHHGSETSSNAAFMNVIQPTHAIVSVGLFGANGDNSHPSRVGYHLPDYSAMRRILDVGHTDKIFLTSKGETITDDYVTAIDITKPISVKYTNDRGQLAAIDDTTMKDHVVNFDQNDIMLTTNGTEYEFLGRGAPVGAYHYHTRATAPWTGIE